MRHSLLETLLTSHLHNYAGSIHTFQCLFVCQSGHVTLYPEHTRSLHSANPKTTLYYGTITLYDGNTTTYYGNTTLYYGNTIYQLTSIHFNEPSIYLFSNISQDNAYPRLRLESYVNERRTPGAVATTRYGAKYTSRSASLKTCWNSSMICKANIS